MKEKQRFSLRKTAAGVASALLGTSLMLTSMAPVLAAEETVADAVNEPAVVQVDDVQVAEANLAQAQKNYEAVLKEFEKWVVYLDEFEEKDVKEAEKARKDADQKVVQTLAALREAQKVAAKAKEKHLLAYGARSEAYDALAQEVKDLVDEQAALEAARVEFDSQAKQQERAKTRTQIARLENGVLDPVLDPVATYGEVNLAQLVADASEKKAKADAVRDALAAELELKPEYVDYTQEQIDQMIKTMEADPTTELGKAVKEATDAETAVTNMEAEIAKLEATLVFDGNGTYANAVKAAQKAINEHADKDKLQKQYNEFIAKDFVKEYNLAKAEREQAEAAEKLAGEAHNAAKAAQLEAQKALVDAQLNQFKVLEKLRVELGEHDVVALGKKIRKGVDDSKAALEVAEKRLELAKGALRKAQGLVDGFAKEDGEWFYYEDGVKKTGWHKASYGTWYFFDEKGGAMVTGWRQVNGSWYYFENWGGMATGWKSLGGSWYYLNPSGAMATGWKKVGQNWYYLNQSGAMATGWKKVGKNWYFLLPSGAMRTEAVKIGGRVYRFAPSGALL